MIGVGEFLLLRTQCVEVGASPAPVSEARAGRGLGRARTLRYVALREDVRDADKAELNVQKATIDSLEPGEVLVIEARDEPGAGGVRAGEAKSVLATTLVAELRHLRNCAAD